MTITDKTRKLLWGPSGNRCAYCYRLLIVEATELDDPSVVGEECHIVSGQPNGPRYRADFPREALDEYDNLILLCSVDHKTIDDQEHTFDEATLHRMKATHERKIRRGSALAPELLDADDDMDPEELVASYGSEFAAFHRSNLAELVPTPLRINEDVATTADLLSRTNVGNLVITGVSGSGKSHLLRHMTLGVLERGSVPVFGRATAYAGNLEQMLDRAVAPFRNTSYEVLRAAAARTGRSLCVVVDAMNECPPPLREQLREEIVALGRRSNHVVWASASDEPHITDALKGEAVTFLPLTDSDRLSIFASYAPRVAVDRSGLTAFATPFEIVVAAETVRQNEGPISAFELLQRFTAQRIQGAERPLIAELLLTNLAREMSRTFRATVLRRTLWRLSEEVQSPDPRGDVAALFRSRLIEGDGNEISFLHEQIQLYFESVHFVSSRGADALKDIGAPLHRRLGRLVIAALDDAEEIRVCAAVLHSPALIREMLTGTLGKRPRDVAQQDASALLAGSTDAIREAEVTLDHDRQRYATLPATAVFHGLPRLSEYDVAILQAIGELARTGHFLQQIVTLVTETERVVYSVTLERDRNSVFAGLYVLRGDRDVCPAGIIVTAATTGWFQTSRGVLRIMQLIEPLSSTADAVLLLACSLLRHSDVRVADALAIFVEAWSRQRYHLTLDALELIQSRRSTASDEEIEQIREVLSPCHSDNLMLSTAIVETMLAYDMIESPASPEHASEEFTIALALPDSEEAYALAYGLISNCFEDLFQGVYLEALHDLTPEQEIRLLTRAALGADPSGFHVSWILHRLLKFEDREALRAYVRWALVDPANSSFPQSSTEAFFLSVGACARLQQPFVVFEPRTKDHEAWRALARIVYWMNSPEPADSPSDLWNALIDSYGSGVVEPLIDLTRELLMPQWRSSVNVDVWTRFPDECRRLLESIVRGGLNLTSIHQWGVRRLEHDAPAFVFGQLAVVGNSETLALLRPLVTHPEWGGAVVDAVRAIERK